MSLPSEFSSLKRPRVSASPIAGALMSLAGIPLVCCLALFTLFMVNILMDTQIKTQRLSSEGAATRGIVTGLKITSAEDSPSYLLDYRFTAPKNGETTTFENRAFISQALYRKLEMGGAVDIVYARSDPSISSAQVELQPVPFWATVLMIVIPFSILAIGVGVVVSGLVAVRRFLKIRSGGQLVQGAMIDKWEGRDGEGGICYYVAYAFRDPTGKVFSSAEQSGMAYNKLNIGDSVDIRYLPENPKISKLENFYV